MDKQKFEEKLINGEATIKDLVSIACKQLEISYCNDNDIFDDSFIEELKSRYNNNENHNLLSECRNKLNYYLDVSDEKLKEEIEKNNKERIKKAENELLKYESTKDDVNRLIKELDDWKIPSLSYANCKKLTYDILKKYEYSNDTIESMKEDLISKEIDLQEYRNKKIEESCNDIVFYTKEIVSTNKIYEDKLKWVECLKESLSNSRKDVTIDDILDKVKYITNNIIPAKKCIKLNGILNKMIELKNNNYNGNSVLNTLLEINSEFKKIKPTDYGDYDWIHKMNNEWKEFYNSAYGK